MSEPRRGFRIHNPKVFIAAAVVVALLAVGTWFVIGHQQQVRFIREVRGLQGFVELKPVGPAWLRNLLGPEHMEGWDVLVGVSVADSEVDDAWLERRRPRLASLEWIDLTATKTGLPGFNLLVQLPGLKEIYVLDTNLTDESLEAFAKKHVAVTVIRGRKMPKASGMAMRPVHAHATTIARFSRDGRWLVTGNGEGELQVWDVERKRLAWQETAHSGWVFGAEFSADGAVLATVGADDHLRLWDVSRQALVADWTAPDGDLHSVRFAPDGRTLFTAGDGGVIHLLDRNGLRECDSLSGHAGPIPAIDLSPDGKRLASVSRDDRLCLWDLESMTEIATQDDHTADVYAVSFSPDGRRLATGAYDRSVILRDSQTGQALRQFTGHTDWVFAVAFSPDSRHLASGAGDGSIRLWDVDSGECEQMLNKQRTVSGLDFRATDGLLASSGLEGNLCLYWTDGTLEAVLRAPRRKEPPRAPLANLSANASGG